jgi:ribosomal protein L17
MKKVLAVLIAVMCALHFAVTTADASYLNQLTKIYTAGKIVSTARKATVIRRYLRQIETVSVERSRSSNSQLSGNA